MIEELRKATRTAHTELDHYIYPIVQSTRSAEDYARLLNWFYAYFKPVYSQLDKHIDRELLPDYDQRRKPSAIEEDLQSIGSQVDTSLDQPAIPSIQNSAQAFGALYVLEGSTMGGPIITKKIMEKTGLHADSFRFFSGYGKNNAMMWAKFIEALSNPSLEDHRDKLIETAIQTFQDLYSWMKAQNSLSTKNQ